MARGKLKRLRAQRDIKMRQSEKTQIQHLYASMDETEKGIFRTLTTPIVSKEILNQSNHIHRVANV
jgi:hypothetical protein